MTDQTEPQDSLPETTLAELPELLRDAAERAGWTELMPVQKKAVPYLRAGRDMMVQSRTGSGKTGAFLLPIIERVDFEKKAPQALVLVPTRELARQVSDDAITLAGDNGLLTAPVYGGVGYGAQREAFRKGAQLVVGTPGRILDHLMRGHLKLDDLEILVLDEADRMLSMGFYPDMRRIQRHLPDRDFPAYLFSATFPPHVLRLSGEFLRDAELLTLSSDSVHVASVMHVHYNVPPLKKDRFLVRILELENPASCIIFCNTKKMVHYVNVVLQRFGYDADELSADLGQAARERVLKRIRDGNLRILVATDVAARGIDIPELSHVIQYEPPADPESYIHRAGRTGRAGAGGRAITLVSEGTFEGMELRRIAQQFKIDMKERKAPTEEDVADLVAQRVTALLEARLRERDRLRVERMQRFLPLVRNLGNDEEAAALLAMLCDDFYQQSLHEPTIPADAEEPRRPRDDGGRGRGSGDRGRGDGGGGGGRRRRGRRRRR